MVELPVFASRRLCRPGLLISYEIVIWNSSRPRAVGREDTVNVKESSAVQPMFSQSICWYNISCSLTWPDSKKNQPLVSGIIWELTYILIGRDTCFFRVYSSSEYCTFPCKFRNIKSVVTYLWNLGNSITKKERKAHWFWDDWCLWYLYYSKFIMNLYFHVSIITTNSQLILLHMYSYFSAQQIILKQNTDFESFYL